MQVDLDIIKTPNNVRLLITEQNYKKPKKGFPYMLPCTLKHNIKQEDKFTTKVAQQLPLKISIVKKAIANIKARGIYDEKTIVKELPNELYNEQAIAAIENPFAPIPRKYKINY